MLPVSPVSVLGVRRRKAEPAGAPGTPITEKAFLRSASRSASVSGGTPIFLNRVSHSAVGTAGPAPGALTIIW